MVVFPVALQGQVERRHRPSDLRRGQPDREYQGLEVRPRAPRQVDPYRHDRTDLLIGPRPVPLLAQSLAQVLRHTPREGRLSDASDAVEREHVPPGRLEVLHVEARCPCRADKVGQASGHRLPFVEAVGEVVDCLDLAIVGTEQRPQIRPAHLCPLSRQRGQKSSVPDRPSSRHGTGTRVFRPMDAPTRDDLRWALGQRVTSSTSRRPPSGACRPVVRGCQSLCTGRRVTRSLPSQ